MLGGKLLQRGACRATPTTVSPRRANATAHSRPIPDDAPVTRTTRVTRGGSHAREIPRPFHVKHLRPGSGRKSRVRDPEPVINQ